VTLSDAYARVLDRCLELYTGFLVFVIKTVCLVCVLGLHSVSNFVKNRRVKLLGGLLDTGRPSATLMRIYCINCLV